MQTTELELARQVQDALANLYDPAALRSHPLTAILDAGNLTNPQRGDAPRERLTAAIERLNPGPQVDPAARAWRPYRILHSRYIEARDPTEVQRELAISRSQYYREHESAIASLAALLSAQATTGTASGGPDSSPLVVPGAPRSHIAERDGTGGVQVEDRA